MKKTVLKKIYELGGFKPFHYLNRSAVLILTYHRFSERGGSLSVSREQFADHLDYLSKTANVISLDHLVDAIETKETLPDNSVAITIDDGYRDAFDIALPLLAKHKMPATLYAISNFLDRKIWLWTDLMRYLVSEASESSYLFEFTDGDVEGQPQTREDETELAGRVNEKLKGLENSMKWDRIEGFFRQYGLEMPPLPTADFEALSWKQARELESNGVSVECHTANHPILTNVSPVELSSELTESKLEIETQLGKEVKHFCYPNGSFNDEVAKAVEETGFASATTTNYGFCGNDADPFRLKRIDGQPAIASFAQSVSGFEVIRERIGV